MLLRVFRHLYPSGKQQTHRWRICLWIYCWYEQLHELDVELKNEENVETLTEAIKVVNAMEQEVREVEVPQSYAEELYNLRVHINLLKNQFERISKGLEKA